MMIFQRLVLRSLHPRPPPRPSLARARTLMTNNVADKLDRPTVPAPAPEPSLARALMSNNVEEKLDLVYRSYQCVIPDRLIHNRRRSRPVAAENPTETETMVKSIIKSGGDLDYAEAAVRKDRPTLQTCVDLLHSMNIAGRYNDVLRLYNLFFHQLALYHPSSSAYNALIKTYVDSNNIDNAITLYNYIVQKGPSFVIDCTYQHLTRGLVSANRLPEARDLLNYMVNVDKTPDALVYNNLISGYLESNHLQSAKDLFNQFFSDNCRRNHDGFIYATFIDYYFKNNMEKEAMELYNEYLGKHFAVAAVNYNVLLKVLLKHGKNVEANSLFDFMFTSDPSGLCYRYNTESYIIMVNECFRLGNVSEALLVFKRKSAYQHAALPFVMDVAGYNNMIEKLCEIGRFADADQVFEEMINMSVMPHVSTFRILFDALFRQGRLADVLKWLNHLLLNTNLKPSSAFLNPVICRLIDKGMMEEVVEIVSTMNKITSRNSIYRVPQTVLPSNRHLHATDGSLLTQMSNFQEG